MKTAISIIILICSIVLALNYNPLSAFFHTETSPAPPAMSVARTIAKAFKAVEKAEGAGATVRRSIGVPQLRNFSPFLMLDHFSVGIGAGFPDHPHRYITPLVPTAR
jgi:hypothetical protein